jgi:hypothetical protein
MGVANSNNATSLSDVVNSAISNVLINNSNSCTQNTTSNQTILVDGITADPGCSLHFTGSQTSVQTPNLSCSSSNANDSQLATQFQTQLQQQAESSGGLGLFSVGNTSVSNTLSKLSNTITNNMSISNISNCVQNTVSNQSTTDKNITTSCPDYCKTGCPNGFTCDTSLCVTDFDNLTQSITQSAVGKCLSTNSTVAKAISDAQNSISQEASSTTGLNLNLGQYGIIIAIVVVLLIIFLIFNFL